MLIIVLKVMKELSVHALPIFNLIYPTWDTIYQKIRNLESKFIDGAMLSLHTLYRHIDID